MLIKRSRLLYLLITLGCVFISSGNATDFQTKNINLEFHGKAVDENGKGIGNARVKYVIHYYPEYTFSKFGFNDRNLITNTNNKGIFIIKGSGIQLLVERVSKSGFLFNNNKVKISEQYEAIGIDSSTKATKSNPAIFIGKKL